MLRVFRPLLLVALSLGTMRAATPEKSHALLNGHDFTGWEYVAGKPADITRVCKYDASGAVAVVGKPVGYIATVKSYKNYKLHAEWRWPANAAKNSNGGILLHISSGPTNNTVWPVCYQAQMKLGRAGDLLPMNGATFAEKLTTPPDAKTPQLDRSGPAAEKPLGEWNSYDVVCRDGAIEVSVNGIAENKVTGCSAAEGKFGFQLEGTPFELRNVKLTVLP